MRPIFSLSSPGGWRIFPRFAHTSASLAAAFLANVFRAKPHHFPGERMQIIDVSIKGTSPLMFAAEQPFEEAAGKPDKSNRDLKPRQIAEQQLHYHVIVPNGDGGNGSGKKKVAAHESERKVIVLPSHNLLKSIQGASTFLPKKKSISIKKIITGGIFIDPAYLELSNQNWTIDARRVGADRGPKPIRYRPRFDSWGVKFSLSYDERYLSEEEIRSLVDHAGSFIGVGTWRPERGGPFGRFQVVGWDSAD
jgi:hypothetical protein